MGLWKMQKQSMDENKEVTLLQKNCCKERVEPVKKGLIVLRVVVK